MTLDGTENAQDIATSEQTTETSETEPETFTREQAEKMRSDALAAAGRDAKALEVREKAMKVALSKAEGLQADIKKAEKARFEKEDREALERAGDDPLARSKVELSQTIRRLNAELGDTRSELGKRDEELTDARKVAAKSTKERNAREIASKYEVDSKILELTDGSVEAMEALAKSLSGKVIPTLKPNGSKTIGGSASFERIRDEMIKNPSNDAKMKRYLEAKKAQEG